MAGKKQNMDPIWNVLNNEVDLGEPTSFLDRVYLGSTQRKCQISKDIVDNYRTMFESRISAEGVEKLPFPQHLRISSWSYDMAGHAKKCVERYCELANKTTQQLYEYLLQPNPCTPTVIQGFTEHVCLPADYPIEDFSEDMATGSMAAAGRSPNKHPRTGSEEDSVDIAALLDRAADRFIACMDTKVDSMMDRLEKRIDEKIDSKLGPVMDRLSVLEKTSSSTRSGPSSLSDNGGSSGQSSATGVAPAVFAPSYMEIKSRQKHTWIDGGSGKRNHH